MPVDTYICQVELTVQLSPKSLVVHAPSSVAAAVRALLNNMLSPSYTRMGMKFVPAMTEVDAREALTDPPLPAAPLVSTGVNTHE